MDELRKLLAEFKDKTQSIINSLDNEEFDNLDILLDDRQAIIETINSLSFQTKDFWDLCNEFDISNLQNKCKCLFEIRMLKAKEELKKISVNKSMNKQYYQEIYVDSIYFNKKI